MEQKTLVGHGRAGRRKSENRALRKEGMIPAVIYGHRAPVSISVEAREFDSKFHTVSENTIISITVDKKETYDVLVKDYQENIIKNAIEHIDFFEIERGKVLRTNIPIHLEGVAKGIREGGIVETLMHEVEIECLPKDIPEFYTLDITDLEIGDSLHVSDLPTGDDVKLLTPEDQSVVVITTAKIVVEETEPEEEGEEIEDVAEGAAPAEGEGEE